MKNKFLFLLLKFTVLQLLCINTFAQEFNLDLPVTRGSIYSQILREERPLQIILPADYQPGSKKNMMLFTF